MKLSDEESNLFFNLHWSLLFYVNKKYNVISGLPGPNLMDRPMEKIAKLEKILCSNVALIDSFVSENPFNFTEEKLGIVKNWKNFVKDDFILLSHSRHGSVFLQQEKDQKAFLAVGLKSDLDEMFPETPLMVGTVLLPFKGKIVVSGIFRPFNIRFGGGVKSDFNESFQIAKSKYGIIASLEEPVLSLKESEQGLLKFYAKNEGNRLVYEKKIEKILKKNPNLQEVFWQEVSKSSSRKIRKQLKNTGAKKGTWFAVLDQTVISSGATEKEVFEKIKEILPEEKTKQAYVFKYK